MAAFVKDLRTGGHFRAGLRVKRVQRESGIYELTCSTGPAGRTTRQYGPALRPGVQHVIWRHIETHDILTSP
ncbi:hypothetical protein [Streptomyces lavendulocolor]|uniref:hypothetical protein n=1 Tax=Streptomyces lavendulocolor TaxID=67316 RepID=UPI003C2F5570